MRSTIVLAFALAACTGDTGPQGPGGGAGPTGPSGTDGTNGTNGNNGTNGTNGNNGTNGTNGNDVIISAEAKHGLDISFFPIDTTGLTGPQIEKLGRGSYLVNAVIDCSGCHTANPTKPFAGGVQFPIDASGHFVYSRNITSDAATGLPFTESQFVQVFQTGVDLRNAGQRLYVMPWPNFRWLATDDIKAIYAYIKLVPPQSNTVPADNQPVQPFVSMPTSYDEGEETRPLLPEMQNGQPVPDPGHMVRGNLILPLAYAKMPNFGMRTPDEQASFGRGSYLVNAAICNDCHTNNANGALGPVGVPRDFSNDVMKIYTTQYLIGGATFVVPPPLNPVLKQTRTMSENLIGANGFFNEGMTTFLLFDAIIQYQAHVDDTPALPLGFPMPADHFRNMTSQDLTDVYTYLHVLAKDYAIIAGSTLLDKKPQAQARYCTAATQATDCIGSGETCAEAALPVGNQCVGKGCTDTVNSSDCDACQVCSSSTNKCTAPAVSSACLAIGL
jgi:hypothetical protein